MNLIGYALRRLLFACLLLLTANAAVAQNNLPDVFTDKKTAGIIPFEYYPPHILSIIIKVSINGEPPLPFILDTGAIFPVTLSLKGAAKLKIHPTAKDKKADDVWVVDIKSLEVPMRKADGKGADILRLGGKAKAVILDAPIFYESYDGAPVAGIVGAGLFEQGVIQFDFAAKTLRVGSKPHKPLHIPGATMLPMHQDEDDHYAVDLKPQEGKPVAFMLDTGAEDVELPHEAAARFHILATYETIDTVTVDGREEHRDALLYTLAIGDDIESNVVATYPEDEKVEGQGILGMNLLTRFRVTMDFPNKQVFFERGTDYKERVRLPAYHAFEMKVRGGKYFVSDVDKGYAADRAGVAEGDRIVKADGVVLQGLPAERVKNLVYGFADTTAHLVLERKGERKEVSYTRYGLQSLVAYPPDGAGMGIEQGDEDTIVIDRVLVNSLAQEAGLESGDTIVTINGKPVKEICFEAVVVALNAPKDKDVKLEVRSKGAATSRNVTLKSRKLR